MDHRQLVRMLAAGRVVVGATLTALPGFAGGMWIGPIAKDPKVKVMIRAMGIRDLALGAGTLQALNNGEPARTWVTLSGVSDVVDAAATIAGSGEIGRVKALPTLLVATTSAIAHLISVGQLD